MTARDAAGVFDRGTGHEQVVFCHDEPTGLKAIIAIYSTALGPALGGTRFYPYASENDALEDVLNLSKGMAYKAALAGLDLGGGKAVIIGDPTQLKTEALLRAYGRFVESLHGRYYTACDVGTVQRGHGPTSPASAPTSPAARSPTAAPGTRRCSRRTASSRACAPRPRSPGGHRPSTAARSGSPGSARSAVIWSPIWSTTGRMWSSRTSTRRPWRGSRASTPTCVRWPRPRTSSRPSSTSTRRAPWAGALDDEVVATLSAKIVCGAANNQLAHEGIEKTLQDRGILYAPDYMVNAGGLIQVADELEGFSFERAKQRAGEDLRHHQAGVRAGRRRGRAPGGRPRTGSPSGG